MYKDQRIVALIPARGGSKRLPRKNVLPLRGIPLIQWSIAAARGSTLIDEVIVSTDDPEIAQIAALAGAVVMDRPSNLALDHTPSLPVFQDALQRMRPEADLLVVMQPTTPFRRVSDIDDSIRRLIDQDADALIAVTKAKMGGMAAANPGRLSSDARIQQPHAHPQPRPIALLPDQWLALPFQAGHRAEC
jgi:CMP-N,N'-diacetyllegionaminic acid synthase